MPSVQRLNGLPSNWSRLKATLDLAAAAFDIDPAELETAEERLFALKAEARKHSVAVDDLAETLQSLKSRLDAIEGSEDTLMRLAKAEQTARTAFETAAKAMTKARREAGHTLAEAVAGELAPLRLNEATFEVAIDVLPQNEWSAAGCDRVVFEVHDQSRYSAGSLE